MRGIEMTQFSDWKSWIIHFGMFFVLMRWSGIKWQWAAGLVLGIEVWECSDWANLDFAYWFGKLDTWLDIAAGALGIWLAKKRLI